MDRNVILPAVLLNFTLSLSARRAWIEIGTYHPHFHVVLVALRKESVDRNKVSLILPLSGSRRSPQGERG